MSDSFLSPYYPGYNERGYFLETSHRELRMGVSPIEEDRIYFSSIFVEKKITVSAIAFAYTSVVGDVANHAGEAAIYKSEENGLPGEMVSFIKAKMPSETDDPSVPWSSSNGIAWRGFGVTAEEDATVTLQPGHYWLALHLKAWAFIMPQIRSAYGFHKLVAMPGLALRPDPEEPEDPEALPYEYQTMGYYRFFLPYTEEISEAGFPSMIEVDDLFLEVRDTPSAAPWMALQVTGDEA